MTGMMISTSTANLNHCLHCGNYHTGQCRLIKAIEYYADGQVRRIEFFAQTQLSPYLPPYQVTCSVGGTTSVIPSEGIRVMDAWDVLGEAIGTVSAPSDWASQHDHYLYGTPKHESDETPSARVIAAINELESDGGEVFDSVDDLFASWEDEAENELLIESGILPNWRKELAKVCDDDIELNSPN